MDDYCYFVALENAAYQKLQESCSKFQQGDYCYFVALEDAVYQQLQESCLKNKQSMSEQISSALTFQSEHIKNFSMNQIASHLRDRIVVPKNYRADWFYDDLHKRLVFDIFIKRSDKHCKQVGFINLEPDL